MSLPARQQRTLDRIERKLIASDPVLHSWFAIFARLQAATARCLELANLTI